MVENSHIHFILSPLFYLFGMEMRKSLNNQTWWLVQKGTPRMVPKVLFCTKIDSITLIRKVIISLVTISFTHFVKIG